MKTIYSEKVLFILHFQYLFLAHYPVLEAFAAFLPKISTKYNSLVAFKIDSNLSYGHVWGLELVSKELNHFGVITGLFRQIGGHSSRFVLFCSFWRLFTRKMIKSVKVFPFSFWKIITKIFFFTSSNSNPRHIHAKWPPSDLTPWTLTLGQHIRMLLFL